MNATQYSYLINNPNAVNHLHTMFLDKVIQEFPYFQSAQALRLKSLYNHESFQYNQELKITAAHTTERNVLFDFITSDKFEAFQKAFFEEKEQKIKNITVNESEIINNDDHFLKNKLQESIKNTIIESENIYKKNNTDSIIEAVESSKDNENVVSQQDHLDTVEKKLQIGKPLSFTSDEKHSFEEWLQLSNLKPINRVEAIPKIEKTNEFDENKKRKLDIIDKFIATNPKIPAIKNLNPVAYKSLVLEENSYIMTETLAKVYLEQKKYQKAIQAYEILILKYPEKFSFFADRISDIKELQQNNN